MKWNRCVFLLLFFNFIYLQAMEADDLPQTGDHTHEVLVFDRTMQEFLQERGYKAATLAVMKDGEMSVRGYGYQDPDLTMYIDPNTRMRVASVSKAFTKLIVEELLPPPKVNKTGCLLKLLKACCCISTEKDTDNGPTLESTFWDIAGNSLELLDGRTEPLDPLVQEITVQQLLDHTAGWDFEGRPIGDPVFNTHIIAEELGLENPIDPKVVVEYVLSTQELKTNPGEKVVYANFGYIMLGRIIAVLKRQPYIDVVKERAYQLGIENIDLGSREPKEGEIGWYNTVTYWPVEPTGAAAGITMDAEAVCRLMNFLGRASIGGAMPGTMAKLPETLTRGKNFGNGVSVAVLLNNGWDLDTYNTLETSIDEVVEEHLSD